MDKTAQITGNKPRIRPLGDSAITLEWRAEISPEINGIVLEAARVIISGKIFGVTEVVPAYRTLSVFYNPFDISYEALFKTLSNMEFSAAHKKNKTKNVVEIPVVYGGEYGSDLQLAAEFCKLTVDEFIKLHFSPEYLVYMIGFMPGFPYLGGLDKRIAVPRQTNPRLNIPAGSVGIGGSQTGIYPLKSPGGWQIIGRTPLKLFDKNNEVYPFLLKAGDYVKFVPIQEGDFKNYA